MNKWHEFSKKIKRLHIYWCINMHSVNSIHIYYPIFLPGRSEPVYVGFPPLILSTILWGGLEREIVLVQHHVHKLHSRVRIRAGSLPVVVQPDYTTTRNLSWVQNYWRIHQSKWASLKFSSYWQPAEWSDCSVGQGDLSSNPQLSNDWRCASHSFSIEPTSQVKATRMEHPCILVWAP